jgi:chemotaxis response regulator CheB
MITLVLADDSKVIRKMIVALLTDDPEIQILGEAANFADLIRLTEALRPEVVVMDVHMKDEAAAPPELVRSCLFGSRVLAISLWKDAETKVLAERYGAVGLLDKAGLVYTLIPSIKVYGKASPV